MPFPLRAIVGAIALMLLSSCTSSVKYSNVFERPKQPYQEVNSVFLTSKLNGMSYHFTKAGYDDLGELFRERAPLVLGANGIRTKTTVVRYDDTKPTQLDEVMAWAKADGRTGPVLLLNVASGREYYSSQSGRTLWLTLQANLYNPASKRREWTSQLEIQLVRTPLVELFEPTKFDKAWMDGALKLVLEQMAKERFIQLPKNEAVSPAA